MIDYGIRSALCAKFSFTDNKELDENKIMRCLALIVLFFICPFVISQEITWEKGKNIEDFWLEYADSKGGITFGKTSEYPEYDTVKEGDTILIELKQGNCLMEFFHGRWRRANDVRRWDESINSYGGCPFVFE